MPDRMESGSATSRPESDGEKYECYGVVFSSPFPLTGFRPTGAEADVRIRFGSGPSRLSDGPAGRRYWSANEREALLRVPEVATYHVTRERSITIDIARPDVEPDQALYGVPIAASLTMEGLTVLHGAGAVVSGEALLFVGANGAGKSSLASAFVSGGAAPICDNLAPIDSSLGRLAVRPGPSTVRLWGDMADRLGVDIVDARRVSDDIDKFVVERAVLPKPAPLGAIIEVRATSDAMPTFERLDRFEATAVVVDNHFRRGVAQALTPDLMARSAAIAAQAPVYSLRRPVSGCGPVELAKFVESQLGAALPTHLPSNPSSPPHPLKESP